MVTNNEARSVGIGLHLPHVAEIAAARPHLGFIEVHAENYMAETPALDRLLDLRCDYPVSIHGLRYLWEAPSSSTAVISAA